MENSIRTASIATDIGTGFLGPVALGQLALINTFRQYFGILPRGGYDQQMCRTSRPTSEIWMDYNDDLAPLLVFQKCYLPLAMKSLVAKYITKEEIDKVKSKFFSLVVILLVSVSGIAYASDLPFDNNSSNEIQFSIDKAISMDYNDLISIIDRKVRALPSTTDGVSEISMKDINEAINAVMRDQFSINSYPYSDSVELCNVLSAADGLSLTRIAKAVVDGYLAQDEANTKPIAIRDAFRHSTWNFRATKSIGATNASIYTTNYEWANVLVSSWINYRVKDSITTTMNIIG